MTPRFIIFKVPWFLNQAHEIECAVPLRRVLQSSSDLGRKACWDGAPALKGPLHPIKSPLQNLGLSLDTDANFPKLWGAQIWDFGSGPSLMGLILLNEQILDFSFLLNGSTRVRVCMHAGEFQGILSSEDHKFGFPYRSTWLADRWMHGACSPGHRP